MKVRTRPLLLAAALLTGTVVPLSVPAAADTGPVPLGMPSAADVVVDEAHGRVFVSGGPSGPGVTVTDLDGTVTATLSFAGATGLALSPDRSRLWMALPSFGLVGLDPVTLVAQERWPVQGCPGDVAVVGTRLVYGYSCSQYSPAGGGYGGIGVLDAVTGQSYGRVTSGPFYEPVVATGPAGRVYAADAGLSPTSLSLYDVTGAAPVLVAARAQACSNLRDLTSSPSGDRVVTSCGSPYLHAVWSADKLTSLPGYAAGPYPLAGAFSADGQTFAGGVDASHDPDVRVHTAGATTRTHDFGPDVLLQPRGLAVSADGSRVWAVTSTRWGPVELRVLGGSSTPTPSTPTSPTSLTLAADPPDLPVGSATTVGGALGSGGATVGGVALTVRRAATGAVPVTLPSVTTRSDGTFSFQDTPPTAGTWTYTVSWGGDSTRAGASASVQVVARAAAKATVRLELLPGSGAGSLSGTVVLTDPAGGLADRPVVVTRTGGGSSTTVASTATDSTGTARFTDPPGPGTWSYTAQVLLSPAGAGAVTTASITLPRTATALTATGPASAVAGAPLTVSGRLTAGGSPVGGAAVRLDRTGCGAASTATVLTSADGGWTRTDPAPPAGSCTWTAAYGGSTALTPATATTVVPVVLRTTSVTLDVVRGTGSAKKLSYVTARLTGGPAGAVLVITAQPSGGAVVELASSAVDASGTLQATYAPRTTTTYRVTYAGDAWHAPASASRTS